MTQRETTLGLMRQMLGPATEFREGQWEAIDLVANQRQRLLVVQRTGWGKSVIYFLATEILRDAGAGPMLLISPLLSLMRNQILAAEDAAGCWLCVGSLQAIHKLPASYPFPCGSDPHGKG
jgi:ATP-dependent DNA helicase RecQ